MAQTPEELKQALTDGEELFLENEDIAAYVEGAAKADGFEVTQEQIMYVLKRESDFMIEIGLAVPIAE